VLRPQVTFPNPLMLRPLTKSESPSPTSRDLGSRRIFFSISSPPPTLGRTFFSRLCSPTSERGSSNKLLKAPPLFPSETFLRPPLTMIRSRQTHGLEGLFFEGGFFFQAKYLGGCFILSNFPTFCTAVPLEWILGASCGQKPPQPAPEVPPLSSYLLISRKTIWIPAGDQVLSR